MYLVHISNHLVQVSCRSLNSSSTWLGNHQVIPRSSCTSGLPQFLISRRRVMTKTMLTFCHNVYIVQVYMVLVTKVTCTGNFTFQKVHNKRTSYCVKCARLCKTIILLFTSFEAPFSLTRSVKSQFSTHPISL